MQNFSDNFIQVNHLTAIITKIFLLRQEFFLLKGNLFEKLLIGGCFMNLNGAQILKMIQSHVRYQQLTYKDFEKIFSFLKRHEKKYVEKFIEHKLKILLVEEIDFGAEEDKKFVEDILQKIEPFAENNQLTYEEFEKIFGAWEKRKQDDVINILAELKIELVDEKILLKKPVEFEQPLTSRKADEIKLSNNMLVSLIQKGDKQARQDICTKNYGLVVKYAKKYFERFSTCLTEEDLIQAGMLGMLTAAEKFNFGKETQFSTYATYWIEQTMRRAVTDTGYVVRLPVHMFEVVLKVKRLDSKFAMLGKDFQERVELIAQETNLQKIKVLEIFKYSDYLNLKSLDEPVGEEKDTPRIDFLPDDNDIFESPENATRFILLKEQMAEVLSTLTPREQKVLKLRFGLEDGKDRTLEEVGAFFNVTRERIRQIEVKALRKLRHRSRSEKLKDFLN